MSDTQQGLMIFSSYSSAFIIKITPDSSKSGGQGLTEHVQGFISYKTTITLKYVSTF